MTIIELIRDALGLINVLNEIETPSAEQGANGLRVLNQMMEQWEEDGLRLQYFEQTATSADFPCQRYTQVGVTAHLAIRLAPVYGATVSPELAAQAVAGYNTICRKSAIANLPVASMSHLPQGDNGTDNILTGDSA